MPSNWLYVDTNFPTFTGRESTEAKVSTIQNYLFMLVEQLRYSLHNLDTGNMNPSALDRYAGGLTDPIYRRLTDDEGNITQLQIGANGLQMQITNNAGDIHKLSVTAGELSSQIADANGDISQLQQTASSISATVANQAGDISQLQITATLLQSQITNTVGDMSYLRQTVDSITLGVVNGQESSTISLYKNGIAVASQNITFNGMVTFNDLNGSHGTVINGSAIDTGTLRLDSLYGNIIYLRDPSGNIGAQFNVGAAASASSRCEMWARAIYLGTYGGDIYLEAQTGYVTLSGSAGVSCANNFQPSAAGRYSCGTAYFPWSAVYATTGQISSSDRAGKEAVDYDMTRYEAFFDRLRPCSFLRKDGTSGRRHHGLIAQDVAAALEETGLTGLDFAGYCAWENEDGGSGCGLRYEELIAMLIYEVQTLKKEVQTLKKLVNGGKQPYEIYRAGF